MIILTCSNILSNVGVYCTKGKELVAFFMVSQLIPYLVVWYFNASHLRESLQIAQVPSLEASSTPSTSTGAGHGKVTIDGEAALDDERRPREEDIGEDSNTDDERKVSMADQHRKQTKLGSCVNMFTHLILIVIHVKSSRKRVGTEDLKQEREQLGPEYKSQLRRLNWIG